MSTVASFCRNCGKALSDEEKVAGSIQCSSCVAQFSPSTPPPGYGRSTMTPMADPGVSPGLAFLLGLIPGVGAIYNGQYAKGLVHVFIFGLLITIASEGHGDPTPILAMMVAGFYFYMPFEAYHTAQKRQRGLPVDEFSSIVPLRGRANGYPVGPLVMIAIGVIFLMTNFDLLRMSQVVRLWPIALIALGVFMLRERLRGAGMPPPPPPPPYRPYADTQEVPHE